MTNAADQVCSNSAVQHDLLEGMVSKKRTGGGYSKSKRGSNQVGDEASSNAFKGYGLAIGLGLGLLVGFLLDNMTAGIIVGAVVGVAVGAYIDERKKRRAAAWKNRYKKK